MALAIFIKNSSYKEILLIRSEALLYDTSISQMGRNAANT